MTDEQAFLNTCLARPEDHLPKLIFADWLEDEGRTTEAWRIRQYLRVYQPEWNRVMRLGEEDPFDWLAEDQPHLHIRAESNMRLDPKCLQRIEQVVRSRDDKLWRLVDLCFLQATLAHFPLTLKCIHWPFDWDAYRFRKTLNEIACRLTLHACGIDAKRERALIAANKAKHAADEGANLASEANDRRAESAAQRAIAVAIACEVTSERDLPEEDIGYATYYAADAAWFAGWEAGDRSAADAAEEAVTAAAYSLWTHIRDTQPAW